MAVVIVTDFQRALIRKLLATGLNPAAIAKQLCLPRSAVTNVLDRIPNATPTRTSR